MNLNSSPCPLSIPEIIDDRDQHRHHPNLAPNYHTQSPVSFRIFFNSSKDHMGCYDCRPSLYPHHQPDDNRAYSQGGSSASEIKNNIESSLKLTLWKNEEDRAHDDHEMGDKNRKRMPSNIRMMQKVKNLEDRVPSKITNIPQDQKFHPSANHSSSNSSSNNNSSIRVCADCNTTKTPLWRSGPNGPKSLCNACGIRQRKARRALAAAATTDQPPAMKIKVQHKENMGKIKGQIKKRRNTAAAATSSDRSQPNNGQKKARFEDFLINLSKKLSFHRMFPEDEKDAAILLMAISSGMVHG